VKKHYFVRVTPVPVVNPFSATRASLLVVEFEDVVGRTAGKLRREPAILFPRRVVAGRQCVRKVYAIIVIA
jgi:hypothetical protein